MTHPDGPGGTGPGGPGGTGPGRAWRTSKRLVKTGMALCAVAVVVLLLVGSAEWVYAAYLAGVLPAVVVAVAVPIYLVVSLFFSSRRVASPLARREVLPRVVIPTAAIRRHRARRLLASPRRVAGAIPTSVHVRRRPRAAATAGAS